MLPKKYFNIYTSVEPLYVYMKLFGLFLPSFVGKSQNGVFSVKTFDKFCFLITLGVTLLLTVLCLNKNHRKMSNSFMLDAAYDMCALSGVLAILIVIIHQLRIWRVSVAMMGAFYTFDEEVWNIRMALCNKRDFSKN